MKITDSIGRSMLVDLMYKDGSRWLLAPQHKLKGRGTNHCEVPHGEVAIKIESILGAEVLVYQDGQLRASVEVEPRTQYVERDSEGIALMFSPAGVTVKGPRRLDSKSHKPLAFATACGEPIVADEDGRVVSAASAPQAPNTPGLVYVVVRVRKQNDAFGEPPQEEFECAFQMYDKSAAERHLAENIHLLVQAPKVQNPADLFDREPMSAQARAARPSFFCTFCNHKH